MAILLRSKSQIFGLTAELAQLTNDIAAANTARISGDEALSVLIGDVSLYAQNQFSALDEATVKKADNLSDLGNVALARTNLGVDSSLEVDAKIDAAKLALGTNYSVATIAERNALTGLTVGDIVFVADSGDGKWEQFKVATVAGGVVTAWVTVMDEDTYLNANSAGSIKTAYESNADTNAFTDAEQAKVSHLSVTAAIDLDKVIQSDELITDITLAGATDITLASAAAIKAYVDSSSKAGGAAFKTESVVVTNDRVVLQFKPKDGMVLNFGTVRHIDASGIAYDIPVVVDGTDATGKTYILSPDSAGQFDTKSVLVQYPYTL